MTDELSPLRTVADGNCFYRAVSLALCGTEKHHVLLRLLTAIELIMKRSSYDTKTKENNFLNDIRIVTSKYEKLVTDALVESSYSEMAQFYALSSAFTRVVCGRSVSVQEPSINIMWSAVNAPDNPKSFNANHFVPLVRKSLCVDVSLDLTADCTFGNLISNDESVTSLRNINCERIYNDANKPERPSH